MTPLGRLLLITVLAIVYGSLYPFHFHAGRADGGPLWVLLHAWPDRLDPLDRFEVRDIAVNVFLYVPLGLFGRLWIGKRKPGFSAACWTIGLALVLSVAMETLQYFDDSREVSLSDVATNLAGGIIGVILATIYGKALVRAVARAGIDATQTSSAVMLLCCWAAYQLFPLFPQLSRYALRAKLAALGGPAAAVSMTTVFAAVDWLTVALLSEVAGGEKCGPPLLALLTILLPARLLILGRTLTWVDIAGAAGAWALWYTSLRRQKWRNGLLAWLAAGTLAARGLAPYHWRLPASPFSWIPFEALLVSDWNSAGLVFFNKSFLYGAAVWLFHRAGYSYLTAAVGVGTLLAAIEALQVYLPGRSPEISDPLMAMILAIALWTLDGSSHVKSRIPAA